MSRTPFIASVLLALLCGIRAAAEELPEKRAVNDCKPTFEATTLLTETASAGYLSNIMNRSQSIRATSKRMLTSAIESSRSKDPVQRVIFTSTPILSKKADDDDPMCARYEQATKEDPLRFEDRHFDSVDDLTAWIMDFTQGKGSDGESLYRQCPGKCSPRYTWWIEPGNSGMKVQARVVCGLPRDRDGDIYELTTALAPTCVVDSKP